MGFRTPAFAALVAVSAIGLRAQDLIELPWRLGQNGELEYQALRDSTDAEQVQFGDWQPMFPGLFDLDGEHGLPALVRQYPITLLPLLVHGVGGAAGIDEAALRLRRLGHGVVKVPNTHRQLRPDPMLDLLRVEQLRSTPGMGKVWSLREYIADERRSAEARAAAAEGLCDFEHWRQSEEVQQCVVTRHGEQGLHMALARLPDDVDAIVGVHAAVLPRLGPLLQAWRELVFLINSDLLRAGGGNISPGTWSRDQVLADRPGQLPCELAARFGNWRVDYALFAWREREGRRGLWCHLVGAFDVQRIRSGLRAVGTERASEHGDVCGAIGGVLVHANANELELCSEAFGVDTRGGLQGALHDRAAGGKPALWLHVPRSSRLLRGAATGCELDATLALLPCRLQATARCPSPEAAGQGIEAWQEWCGQRSCRPDAKFGRDPKSQATWRELEALPAGCAEGPKCVLAFRRCLAEVIAEQHDERCTFALDLAALPLDQAVRLLAMPLSVALAAF